MEYSENVERAFSPTEASAIYEKAGLLSADAFFALLGDALKVRALKIPDLDWLLLDHLLTGTAAPIPLEKHIEAIAAGYQIPFSGIEGTFQSLIVAKLIPAWTLNRTTFYQPPADIVDLGDLMVSCGLLSAAGLKRGHDIQLRVLRETGVIASLGQILRSVSSVSIVDFFQVLALRVGMPFEGLDASAPRIYDSAMRRGTLTHRTKPSH